MNLIIDFDSTISSKEMLETLFEESTNGRADKEEILTKIEQITKKGMTGQMSFSESLKERIAHLEFDSSNIEKTVGVIRHSISDSFIRNLNKLKQLNYYIVSGGFKNIIDPIVEELGLDNTRVYANELVFEAGVFQGVDMNNPLAADNGKVNVVKSLNLSGTIAVVGDGNSDLNVKKSGVADYMFYYSEFVNREEISNQSDYVLDNFDHLFEVLANLP